MDEGGGGGVVCYPSSSLGHGRVGLCPSIVLLCAYQPGFDPPASWQLEGVGRESLFAEKPMKLKLHWKRSTSAKRKLVTRYYCLPVLAHISLVSPINIVT